MTHFRYAHTKARAKIFSLFCLFGLTQVSALACGDSGVPVTKKTKSTGGRTSTNSGGSASTSDSGGTAGTSTSDSGGTAGTSTSDGGGTAGAPNAGSAGTPIDAAGGAWNGQIGNCGLPAAGATGVPKPAGTPGAMTILNWAGYKGAVSYTFDDGNQTQIANYAALQALGVHYTFYLLTGKSTINDPIWTQALRDGHELGNHTKSHFDPAATLDQKAADLDAATAFYQTKFGIRPWTMAAPYGDAAYATLTQTRFFINRGVSNALIAPNGNSNPFNLPCFIPNASAPASDFNAQIDTAEAAGSWRVVLVHGFTGGTDGAYQPVDIAEFTAGVQHAKSLGDMWIDSVVNVGAYWMGQRTLSKITATTSGSDLVWNWTLPANFPPGTCLRVTVPGGTLTQGGNVIPWDDHGYYEISLDARKLTLSP